MDKRTFPDISPRAFEHPLDRTALATLHKITGLDWVARRFLGAIGEKRLRLLFLASAVRVSERQFPALYARYREACRILDVAEPPELFVAQRFFANAAAIGVDKPFIIVTSSLLEMLDDDELQCVVGHELGHVLCGHALYTTLLLLLLRFWYAFLGLPGGAYALLAINLALLEWSRKAELTADRAGLLVAQDLEVAQRVDMKLAGGRRADQMSLEEFRAQAAEYEAGGNLLDGVLKLVLLLGQSHPFPVLRVAELGRWVESGGYDQILRGDYPRRDQAPRTSWVDNVKATAASYKESFDESKDPFFTAVRDFGSSAAAAGADLFNRIKRAVTAEDEGPAGAARPRPRRKRR